MLNATGFGGGGGARLREPLSVTNNNNNNGGHKQQHQQQQQHHAASAPYNNNNIHDNNGPPLTTRWRSVVNALIVELMASLLVALITVMCWTVSTTDGLQFMPSVALGLVLLCIKDEDYFFPDVLGPTLTFVLWILGGYSWTGVMARVCGQGVGVLLALWVCMHVTSLPALQYRDHHTLPVVFALEAFGTAIEQMAAVYVVMPLLPPSSHHLLHQSLTLMNPSSGGGGGSSSMMTMMMNTHNNHHHNGLEGGESAVAAAPHSSASPTSSSSPIMLLPKIKPKSHEDTHAPSNQEVMHASVALSGLHWCLTRGLCIEMNPLMTLMVAILRQRQHEYADKAGAVWSEATVAMWGQLVGTVLCIVQVALFAPRHTKYWPGMLSGGGGGTSSSSSSSTNSNNNPSFFYHNNHHTNNNNYNCSGGGGGGGGAFMFSGYPFLSNNKSRASSSSSSVDGQQQQQQRRMSGRAL
jgi:hypothetical protein